MSGRTPCRLTGRQASAGARGCSSMAEHQLPKLTVRVRFSSPAPGEKAQLAQCFLSAAPEQSRVLILVSCPLPARLGALGFGAPARGRWPGRKQRREDIERECVIETGTIARTTAGERWASWPTPGRRSCRALPGGSPDGHAAAARSAGPHPQVSGTRRHAALMAALARTGTGPSSVPASSRRARSQSRALPAVASPRRWAQAPTLQCDLSRQDHGTYRRDRAK